MSDFFEDNSTSNEASQPTVIATHSPTPPLEIGEHLQLSDYVQDVPLSPRTTQDIKDHLEQQREVTRTNLSMWLLRLFSCSLLATFIMMALVIFNPKANQSALKDLLLLVIPPQTTLLGAAFGYYFGAKDK
ncbi:hypothetical protein [Trichocoleus sp. FACHB-262]|uniref:hypothetical protein n=1 Tax=Trichocoleus sp. FACHB-262 TaxID=2692869 RepID=UPI0016853909|nr:hypothetical protein [Trichocoleus sp. FACHB-262]MBD2124566.1 hypothetical protein [Trichocoleus sp. FACHB-262]